MKAIKLFKRIGVITTGLLMAWPVSSLATEEVVYSTDQLYYSALRPVYPRDQILIEKTTTAESLQRGNALLYVFTADLSDIDFSKSTGEFFTEYFRDEIFPNLRVLCLTGTKHVDSFLKSVFDIERQSTLYSLLRIELDGSDVSDDGISCIKNYYFNDFPVIRDMPQKDSSGRNVVSLEITGLNRSEKTNIVKQVHYRTGAEVRSADFRILIR